MKVLWFILLLSSLPSFAGEVANGGAGNGASSDQPQSYFKQTESIDADTSPFAISAKECGEANQNQCTPDRLKGKTMCGMAVRLTVKCMSKVLGHDSGCSGQCGNGKDFVNCSNGELEKCGYKKIIPTTSKECTLPGAVLAYSKSPTMRGRIYGHVEFVCGKEEYCSIYSKPHKKPWPRETADGCWYPDLDAQKKSREVGV